MVLLRLIWQIPSVLFCLLLLLLVVNEYALARSSRRTKDLAYVTAQTAGFDAKRHRLDVYTPKAGKASALRPVVVFIHGGSWDSGNKNLYTFIGRRLAAQGLVAVLINYRLAPAVQVSAMADDCARAVQWTRNHITDYGGDPARIFVMGHSAGGGLAALLATDDRLFSRLGEATNLIKGAVLDDAGGLDMFDYLQKMEYSGDERYLVPFGRDPAEWREVSPFYHLKAGDPPMLVYVGERTYPSIARSTRRFRQRLQDLGLPYEFREIPGKTHVGMVTQLFRRNNLIYKDILKLTAPIRE